MNYIYTPPAPFLVNTNPGKIAQLWAVALVQQRSVHFLFYSLINHNLNTGNNYRPMGSHTVPSCRRAWQASYDTPHRCNSFK